MTDSAELAAFKERLWQTTQQTADRYGWCGTWRDAMRELGVGPATKEYVVTTALRVTTQSHSADTLRDSIHYSAGVGGVGLSVEGATNWTVDTIQVIDPDAAGLPF